MREVKLVTYPPQGHYQVWVKCDWGTCDFWYKDKDGVIEAHKHVRETGHRVFVQAIREWSVYPDRSHMTDGVQGRLRSLENQYYNDRAGGVSVIEKVVE